MNVNDNVGSLLQTKRSGSSSLQSIRNKVIVSWTLTIKQINGYQTRSSGSSSLQSRRNEATVSWTLTKMQIHYYRKNTCSPFSQQTHGLRLGCSRIFVPFYRLWWEFKIVVIEYIIRYKWKKKTRGQAAAFEENERWPNVMWLV